MIIFILAQTRIAYITLGGVTNCMVCHLTPLVNTGGSNYVLGSYYWVSGSGMVPMLWLISVSGSNDQFSIPWAYYFTGLGREATISSLKYIGGNQLVVGGGHNVDNSSYDGSGFFGIFDLSTQQFIWVKRTDVRTVRGIAYNGSNRLMFSTISGYLSGSGALIYTDLSGNVLWSWKVDISCDNNNSYRTNFLAVEYGGGNTYYALGAEWCNDALTGNSWQPNPFILGFDPVANTYWVVARIYGGWLKTQNMVRDNVGNLLVFATDEFNNAYLIKLNTAGTILFQRAYQATIGQLRITSLSVDVDGNYLLTGFVKQSNGSGGYLVIMKVSSSDGSLLFAKYYNGSIAGYNNLSRARSVIRIGPSSALVAGWVPSWDDEGSNYYAGGTFVILANCFINLTVTAWTTSFSTTTSANVQFPSAPSITNVSLTRNNITPITESCLITPVSNNENCSQKKFLIRENKIILSEASHYYIYTTDGKLYKKGYGKEISLKSGLYIMKIEKQFYKIIIE